MNCIKAILLFLLVFSSVFAAESWRAYSEPLPIRSAVSYGDGVLVATGGGIRYRSLSEDVIYTSQDGLETTAFYSLASSGNRVFAVSEYGLIAVLEKGQSRWKVVNRSYLNNRSRAIPHMVSLSNDILVVGFEDRLAFFNTQRSTSILTINRISNVSLAEGSLQGINSRNDSLFVVLGGVQYARKMDWKNLEKDVRLSDPDSWSKIGKSSSKSDKVIFNGKILNDPVLYEKGKKRIEWILSSSTTNGYFVGPDVILYYNGSSFENLTFSMMDYIGEVYEMKPISTGGVLVASYNVLFAINDGQSWSKDSWSMQLDHGNFGYGDDYDMKVMSVTSDGFILYHVWGEGFFLYSDWGKNLKYKFEPSNENLCMDQLVDDFTVALSSTVAPDSLGFLTATASEDGFSLVYISLDGRMTCLKNVGDAPYAGPIFSQQVEDGSFWDVYVGTREKSGYSASGNFERIRITAPSKNSGRLVLKEKVSYGGLDNTAPLDMAYDANKKILWMVSNSLLGYYEIGQDTIRQPSSTRGLLGAEYSSVEVDVQGNVWVGTLNKGVYRLSRVKSSNDTLSVIHFSEKDGLLKDKVSDIAIDAVLGMAWFSHANGVTVYERNDLRNAENMMTDDAPAEVKAYPNPFRPKIHPYVSIDNIEENASVSIFNRGGALIRYFSGSDVLGGCADWDGRDKNGRLVVPGVYYYVVKGSSKVKKGKIILIH